jgi:uncharacterized protein (TIGR04255 family)
MAEQPYKQPPITEAVIELRFAAPMETGEIEKVSAALKSLYPLQQPIRGVGVHLNVPSGREGAATAQPIETHGYRLSTEDQTQIVLVFPTQFIFSQLAPYSGWDVFFGRFCRDWALWKRTLSYRKITRIGVRYINRIDIPLATTSIIKQEDYLNIYPHLPATLDPVMSYSVVAQRPVPDIGCILTLNSSSAPSPLLGHGAFIIDQDIAKEGDPPQNDEGIYALLNQIRVKKNEIFEACITPRARELFKPWLA